MESHGRMDRLVDYFAVVGYDFNSNENPNSVGGKVLTRIPEQDWEGEPFIQGIELFCQPSGWSLSKERQPPKFFVCVLTDALGKRHYCAVLSFSEPSNEPDLASPTRLSKRSSDGRAARTKSQADIDSSSPTNGNFVEDFAVDESMCQVEVNQPNENSNELKASRGDNGKEDTGDQYSPKCLVLISRHHEFTVLKNCLGLIYTIYIEGLSVSLETVIANLLIVNVPPRGASIHRFSIGAADKQALQSPQCEELPVTRSSVTMLLHQLGILNVMNILCAALVDQKLLFYSCSFTRLTESCNALTALMFPFTYSYPYIPILPHNLLECTASPTPFLIGVHSSFKSELHDLIDVVTVDLDGGVISIPECISIPGIPEPYYTRAVELLTKVLCPDLVVADYAYPPEQINTSEPEKLDKEIRAIFLRLFCQLLMGYRSCLQVCRIHPRPIIRFQKELFLNIRGYNGIDSGSSVDFMPKLVDSQAFSLFIQEEGPPYRRLNIFDRAVAEMPEQMRKEGGDINRSLRHIKDLAYELYRNEHPSAIHPTQKVPKPSETAYLRPHQARFPKISPTAVQTFMTDKLNNSRHEAKNVKPVERPNIRVPDGPPVSAFSSGLSPLKASSRRLEVLRSCVQFIFENRTLETKKIFHAVLRALKNRAAREALTHELNSYASTKPQLDNQQFDYIARLCNCALEACNGEEDQYVVPADLLPALSAFYRKLCPTVVQFLYTVVQEQEVWSSIGFWEFTFYLDVQNEMCRLYHTKKNNRKMISQKNEVKDTSSLVHDKVASLSSMRRSASNGNLPAKDQTSNQKETYAGRENALCLEIAATELRDLLIKSEKEKKELALAEEGVIFGQIQHTSQRMVFMLVPLDGRDGASRVKFLRNPGIFNEDSSNSYFTNSLAGSITGSIDEENEFSDELDSGDMTGAITKFVSMFVDRTCSETGISADYSKSLLSKVPNLVLMQHESLHDVCRESKRLPPIKKAKLLQPNMLPGETLYTEHTLRAYLSADGRLIATGGPLGGPSLLPAVGAIFLTNYRLIFIGIPCDTLASEQVVIRSFPVSALFKIKLFSDSDRFKAQKIESPIQHWALLYSTTFQLIVIGFDEEDVTEEQRVAFEQKFHSLRNPPTIEGVFAVQASSRVTTRTRSPVQHAEQGKGGRKSQSSGQPNHGDKGYQRHGAKSLMKQAKRKAGLTLGKQPRLSRLMTDSKMKTLYFTPASGGSTNTLNSRDTLGRMPPMDETLTKTLTDKGTIDRLFQRMCRSDYKRLQLIGGTNCQFRVTNVNRMFSVCRSYPICSVVPKSVSEESVKSLAHCHHQNRFPCITWMHPATKAVLVRAGAIRSRTVAAIFKHGQTAQPLSDEGTMGSSAEEERFLFAIISSMEGSSPNKAMRPESSLFRIPSNTSLSKISNEEAKSPMIRSNNGFTSSFRENRPDSISGVRQRKWGTLSRTTGKPASEFISANSKPGSRLAVDKAGNGVLNVPGATLPVANLHAMAQRSQLYVFGDKSQIKNMRQEQQGRVEFVPIDLPEPKQVRASFKTLLKACLPVDAPQPPQSSQPSLDDTQLYRKAVEDSGWLQQVSSLLSVAGAVVDVMDVQGASVMIAVEDGWDVTPQLSSLAQVMMDPYYRTVEGFQTLVQKEWLSFGHRFSHRNHFNEVISSGYTPIFLQFLDSVYQILHQFPLAFQFNSMYLQTLAYHCTSNRFTTFILDSDFERLEAGILFETKSGRATNRSTLDRQSSKDASPVKSPLKGQTDPRYIKSFWEYINLAHKNSPRFLNTLYCPDHFGMQVLRPVTTLCRMHIWPHYVQELLADCPVFDGLLGELSTGTSHNEQEATEVSEAWGGQSGRRVVNSCYDNIAEAQPDIIRSLVQQIEHLRCELNKPTESWQDIWDSATISIAPKKHNIPSPTRFAREQAKSIHKRLTVDIIIKRSVKEEPGIDSISLAGDMGTLRPENDDAFDTASLYQFQTNTSEVRTYEGTLWKQGAYMKNWKQRFFVLDSTKHQLRQYESKVDQVCKSVFDLKEVESVQLVDSISGAPKGVEDKSFFELKTSKRLYHFIAESDEAAKKWIDVLQSALHG